MQEHYVRQEFVGFGPQNYLLPPACLTPIYWTDVCVCTCKFVGTKCPIIANFDRGGFTFYYFVANEQNYWQNNYLHSNLFEIS